MAAVSTPALQVDFVEQALREREDIEQERAALEAFVRAQLASASPRQREELAALEADPSPRKQPGESTMEGASSVEKHTFGTAQSTTLDDS